MNEYEKVRKRYISEMSHFAYNLMKIPNIKIYPSSANFVLINLGDRDSFDFSCNLLIKHGLYVRECSDKKGLEGNYIRLACRTSKENKEIIKILREELCQY